MKNKTSHSEYGELQKVFIKRPEAAFLGQEIIDQQWEVLNFLSCPNMKKAIEEYELFEKLLKSHGAEVQYFSKDESVTMDSIYCRDATIMTDYGMVICNMGKEQRVPESKAAKKDYTEKGIKVLGYIEAPGTIEGGDVAWLDQHTLAVGHGYRTNDEGYEQLSTLLKPYGINLIQVDLPHYKGESDVFHLMSIFSPVAADKAVVYSPLMPVRFRQELLRRGYQLIEVPDEEFDSMGCNVLALASNKCLMVKGNPITKERLEAAACEVLEYTGEEISVKGGGGPTCLTRPVWRAIF